MVKKELISKIDSTIIYFVFGVPMLLFIGFVVFTMITGPSTQELIRADDLAKNCTGRVDSLFYDKRNHNGRYAVLQNGKIYPIARLQQYHIEVGDSLSKKEGSFILEVFKKNGARLTLDYRDTYKKEK